MTDKRGGGKKKSAETGGSGGTTSSARENKRQKTTEEGAQAATATAPSPPPPPSLPSAGALAPQQQQQQHQHQHQNQRTAEVLFFVLESLRADARAARAAARAACDNPFPTHGAGDEDDDAGAVVGGGWRAEEEADDDDDDDGHLGSASATPPAARLFAQTCLSASRVCRDWRQVAFDAADHATVRLIDEDEDDGDDEDEDEDGGGGGLARSQQRVDPLSALMPYVDSSSRGCVLRALWLRGFLPDHARLRSLARALGVVKAGNCRLRPGDASLASLLRGLRVLRISDSSPLISALSGVALCPSPPSPPLLGNLVTLEMHAYASKWSPPPSRRSNAARRPGFFSRLYLPSLRVLTVELLRDSDCPLDLLGGGYGGGGGSGGGGSGLDDDNNDASLLFLPPPVTRLRVLGPAPNSLDDEASWPIGEPLYVSVRMLRALAPSLRSFHADATWACAASFWAPLPPEPGQFHPAEAAAAKGEPAPYMPAPVRQAWELVDELRSWRRNHPQATLRPAPFHIAPMARLAPALTALSTLASLSLDNPYDFVPEPVLRVPGATADQIRRARRREWRQACRALLAPLAHSLLELRLDLESAKQGTLVSLPAISCLSRLTLLDVSAQELPPRLSTGIRFLRQLRSLSVRTYFAPGYDAEDEDDLDSDDDEDDDRPYVHPPVHAGDLEPLTLLETLYLSDAAPCVAPLIEAGLPSLRSILLWTRAGCGCGAHDHRLRGPPKCVLSAALRRKLRDGVAVSLAEAPSGYQPLSSARPDPFSSVALEKLIKHHGGDRERMLAQHHAVHVRLLQQEADGGGSEEEDGSEA